MESGEGIGLLLLGVAGPSVTGIAFTYLTRDKEGRRDYWKRVIDFKRIGIKWFLVIFLFVPAMHIVSAIIDVLLRIAQLVQDFPEIVELDINPLMVYPKGQGAIAIDMRMVLSN